MPWTMAWLLPLCGLIGRCRPDRPPHRWLLSGNTSSAPWSKHVRPSVHAWAPAAERLWSASVTDLDPGCQLTCPQITCSRMLCGCGHPSQHCGRLPRQISDWCQDVCYICYKATSGWSSRCQWRASLKPCRQTSVQPPATAFSHGQSARRCLRCPTRREVPYHRPSAQETDFRPHTSRFAKCVQEQLPTNAADVAPCLGPPRGTQGAILTQQRSALCQDLPLAYICSMTLAGHGSRWSAPRELPSHQCSPLSHYGRAHGKEAGANDETCPERRRSLSLTYELMRLRTNTCLDSWMRRMAQTTGRQPGAAHRPLARGMKRPSSTALRQGRSFPEFTLSKRMTGSLRPSSGRRERMEHRRPKHKSEPRHPAPFEVPWARHPPRRPAGQTPAAEHRLRQADKQLVRVLPRTRMVTQQGRRRHHFSNNRYPVDHHSMRPTRGAREVDHRPQQKRLRARKRGGMPGPARRWQMAGPSGKGSLGQTQAQPSFLAGDFGKPSPGPLYEPQKGHSTSGAKAHAQRRTGPRGTPRRVAQASPTAPCTARDPLRLKRKGRWCRLDRPLRHGAVIGPVAGPRRLGKFLGITRCDQSVLLFQVREAISQHKGQHVLDKSASGSLRDRCVPCCDLRAGSAYTTSCKPQSTRPWPDHAPHGCRRPEQCKIDNGPDARGLKQPPSQQEVKVDLRCISNMDEDELMLHACLRAEQLLQNLAAVSGKPGLEAITEDQLIQASAMYHCSITQELKGGLINDQAAKAARKVAVQLRFSIPCAIGDTQASCRPHASEMWSPSYFCPPGPSSSRSLVHRGGLALGVEGKIYTCQYQLRGKRPTCRRAIIGRGHWRGDSVDSVASMSGGPTQAPADGEQVAQGGQGVVRPAFMRVVLSQVCCPSERTRSAAQTGPRASLP